MTWVDVEGSKLKEPEIAFSDFLKSLKNARPSVSRSDIEKHIEFTNEFGQEVSVLLFLSHALFHRFFL